MAIKVHKKNLEWFIDTVLIHDIGQMVSVPCLRYLSFGVVAVGIELLGACVDNEAFGKEKLSTARFNEGIRCFLGKVDRRYLKYNQKGSRYYLYGQLRCGMAHLLRTGGRVSLTTRMEAKEARLHHLEVHPETKKLVLIAENFYNDFSRGCRELKKQLPSLRAKYPKLCAPYLPSTAFRD